VVGLTGFPTFYNEQNRPSGIIDAVAEGNVDVAIVWGPLAGYFAKQQEVPLALSPLPDLDVRTRTPFAFGFAVGVRKSESALLARIQEVAVVSKAQRAAEELARQRLGGVEQALHQMLAPDAEALLHQRVLVDRKAGIAGAR